MKKTLMAALSSLALMTAIGCVNDGSVVGGFDPNLQGSFYNGPGYEIIQVDPIDPRPPVLSDSFSPEPIESCANAVGGIVAPLAAPPDSVSKWPGELRAQAPAESNTTIPDRLAHLSGLKAHAPAPSCQTLAGAAAAPRNPCDCTDDECLHQWVGDNLGCNVCVAVTCGDRYPHSCVRCP